MLSAQRDLLLEPLQAWLRREADRARKAQSDAAKLKKHVETFYSDLVQRSQLAARLRPALPPWLVYPSPMRMSTRRVSWRDGPFQQSRAQLLNVANGHDDADLPRAPVCLVAWESHRAADTIDYVIQHGVPQTVEQAVVRRRLSVKLAELKHKVVMAGEPVVAHSPPPNLAPALLTRWRQINQA